MINFLAFDLFKPSTWLSGSASGVMGAILGGIRTFLFEIVSIIYQLIVNIYNLFQKLCSARILSNSILGEMAQRIGLVLGLVMFFYIIFALIQMLMNPEKISDKEKGAVSIIKKAIIVIVLLGASNGAFGLLYKVQNQIIDSNVISNIILPYKIEGEAKENFGNLLSMQLLMAFYQVDTIDEQTISDADGKEKLDACSNLTNAFYQQIYEDNKYGRGFLCLNESVEIIQNSPSAVTNGNTDEVYLINFNGIVAVLVGGFTVYLLLMYCFKIGVRMIQLAFLEIISPMAFISYLAPKKDTMLTKWWKIYFATYIDVFIRIAIINFVVFLICTIFAPTGSGDGNFTFWQSLGNPEGIEKGFLSVVIILSLLTFAKKAPDLIKELIPASASKLGFGMAMKDIVGLEKTWKGATGVLGGALGGAATGLLGGGLGGFAGGLLKGGLSGLKGQGFAKTAANAWKERSKTNAEMAKVRANGGGWFGYNLAKMQHNLGIMTAAEDDEQRIADLEARANLYNTASKEAESESLKNASHYLIQAHDGGEWTLGELEQAMNNQTYDDATRAAFKEDYTKLLKAATTFNLDYGLVMENGRITFDNDGNLDYLRDSTGTDYNTYEEINRISNKEELLGKTNYTIEANMSSLAGKATNGRGKTGKDIRNNNNNEITRIKISSQYKRNKANNGK